MVPNVMLGGYLVFWAALGLAPLDPGNWVLASILPLTFVGTLLFGRRALPLSAVSYALIAGFLALHTVGAHYTYAQVPLGHWLQTVFGLERNDFDRLVHFAFGLCLTFPLLEAFRRLTGARGLFLLYLTFMTQLGLAGAWEIIEAGVAELARPDLGIAFVGAQGDPWDAQHDMLAATLGTVIGLLVSAGGSLLTRPGRAEGVSRPTEPSAMSPAKRRDT
jgi:putative membrane protein